MNSKYMAIFYVRGYNQDRTQRMGPFVGFLNSEPGEDINAFRERARKAKYSEVLNDSSIEFDIMTNLQPGLNT